MGSSPGDGWIERAVMPSGCRILVVEDHPGDRAQAVQALAQDGHDVVEAENGLQALERVGERLPDVVVLDLMMPVMDGATFLRALQVRGVRSRVRVVLTTGLVSRHVQSLVGADACLFKPYADEELRATVATLCAPPADP